MAEAIDLYQLAGAPNRMKARFASAATSRVRGSVA